MKEEGFETIGAFFWYDDEYPLIIAEREENDKEYEDRFIQLKRERKEEFKRIKKQYEKLKKELKMKKLVEELVKEMNIPEKNREIAISNITKSRAKKEKALSKEMAIQEKLDKNNIKYFSYIDPSHHNIVIGYRIDREAGYLYYVTAICSPKDRFSTKRAKEILADKIGKSDFRLNITRAIRFIPSTKEDIIIPNMIMFHMESRSLIGDDEIPTKMTKSRINYNKSTGTFTFKRHKRL